MAVKKVEVIVTSANSSKTFVIEQMKAKVTSLESTSTDRYIASVSHVYKTGDNAGSEYYILSDSYRDELGLTTNVLDKQESIEQIINKKFENTKLEIAGKQVLDSLTTKLTAGELSISQAENTSRFDGKTYEEAKIDIIQEAKDQYIDDLQGTITQKIADETHNIIESEIPTAVAKQFTSESSGWKVNYSSLKVPVSSEETVIRDEDIFFNRVTSKYSVYYNTQWYEFADTYEFEREQAPSTSFDFSSVGAPRITPDFQGNGSPDIAVGVVGLDNPSDGNIYKDVETGNLYIYDDLRWSRIVEGSKYKNTASNDAIYEFKDNNWVKYTVGMLYKDITDIDNPVSYVYTGVGFKKLEYAESQFITGVKSLIRKSGAVDENEVKRIIQENPVIDADGVKELILKDEVSQESTYSSKKINDVIDSKLKDSLLIIFNKMSEIYNTDFYGDDAPVSVNGAVEGSTYYEVNASKLYIYATTERGLEWVEINDSIETFGVSPESVKEFIKPELGNTFVDRNTNKKYVYINQNNNNTWFEKVSAIPDFTDNVTPEESELLSSSTVGQIYQDNITTKKYIKIDSLRWVEFNFDNPTFTDVVPPNAIKILTDARDGKIYKVNKNIFIKVDGKWVKANTENFLNNKLYELIDSKVSTVINDTKAELNKRIDSISDLKKLDISSTGEIDIEKASYFKVDARSDIALNIINEPSVDEVPVYNFTLEIKGGKTNTITWFNNITWNNDIEPVFENDGVYIFNFLVTEENIFGTIMVQNATLVRRVRS